MKKSIEAIGVILTAAALAGAVLWLIFSPNVAT